MDWKERRERSRASLALQQLDYGKAHTYQIDGSTVDELTQEQRDRIRNSLEHHGINLKPIVVRPIPAREEYEYECVYGQGWLAIAKELEIEKVLVWRFPIGDADVETVREEFELLFAA